MITRERLEELINQGVIIFGKYREYILRNREEKGDDFWWKRQVEIVNNELHYIYEDSDYYENDDLYIDLKDLYETKEDAEFVAKYHTQRVVKFNPPTWAIFSEEETDIVFDMKDGRMMLSHWIIGDNHIVLIKTSKDDDFVFSEPLTKENYIKAVEKARKLFLGESDEN